MFIVGNFLDAIATVADVLLNALLIIVLINAVLSWVRPDPSNPIVAFLERVSDAVCNPIRRMFPTTVGGLDFAPFIVMLAIWFLQMFLVNTLRGMALRMG